MADSRHFPPSSNYTAAATSMIEKTRNFCLQKLGLELICPICLEYLNRPVLLPCNHILCNGCLTYVTDLAAKCGFCSVQVAHRDIRPAPFMENIVANYKRLRTTYSTEINLPLYSDDSKALLQSNVLDFTGSMTKGPVDICQEGNSESGQAILSRGNKRVWVPCSQNYSVADEIVKKEKVDYILPSSQFKNFNSEVVLGRGQVELDGLNQNSPLPSFQVGFRGLDECNTVERDTNKKAQTLLDSPPSFGDTKGSDNNNICDQSPEQIIENLVRGSIRKNDDRTGEMRPDSSTPDTDGHLRNTKRHKKLSHGLVKGTHPELEHKSRTTNESFTNNTICAFCQCSTISEVTGPILHYSKGKLVEGDEATASDVISVHSVCINWAPQVFYKDEKIQNLRAEVTRSARLKCSGCGKKGAALGCFLKSCRKSYHVTCAIGIPNCRWDYESFLLLCPSHCSVKFPNEKLNANKHKQCQLSDSKVASHGTKGWVLCPSGLSCDEKVILIKFAELNGATVSKDWRPDVTHVIAAVDGDGAYVRTFKILMAMLSGRWILTIDWVKACMETKHHVDEEPYEVGVDNQGCRDGPKTSRLRALSIGPKLFSCVHFYFAGDFVPARKEDYEDLIIAAGGTVFNSTEGVLSHEQGASMRLVVYNLDPPAGCKLDDQVSILWKRLNEAQDAAAKIGSQIVGHTWLLESIATCELQPIVC